jgi:5'-deoxynucleotidase
MGKSDEDWVDILSSCSGDIRRIEYVQRFSTIPVTCQENVAQHTFYVTLYSILIHMRVDGNEDLIGSISTYATIHDLIESVSGDVIRTFKYSSDELLNEIENAENKIIENFPNPIRNLYSMWKRMANNEEEYVKSVVKAADFLSLFEFMNREVLRGNKEIDPYICRMKKDFIYMSQKCASNSNEKIREIGGLYMAMYRSVGSQWSVTA